jgi:hypothetical protein
MRRLNLLYYELKRFLLAPSGIGEVLIAAKNWAAAGREVIVSDMGFPAGRRMRFDVSPILIPSGDVRNTE